MRSFTKTETMKATLVSTLVAIGCLSICALAQAQPAAAPASTSPSGSGAASPAPAAPSAPRPALASPPVVSGNVVINPSLTPATAPATRMAPVERPAEPAASRSERNYLTARDALIPMEPPQLQQLQRDLDEQRRASRPQATSVPRTSAMPVDLSPGAAPSLVRVAAFTGAAVSFFDVAGQPWSIVRVRNHNGRDFEIEVAGDGSNTLFVDNRGVYGYGSASVMLEGLPTPIPLSIFGGQRETDSKIEFRVPRRKPSGAPDPVPALRTDGSTRHDLVLLSVLTGVAPDGARELRASHPGLKVWRLGDALLVRSALTIMSAFDERVSSPDGTSAYKLPLMPVLTISVNGRQSIVTIDL
jgi:hypothetical protein